ncbi:MAG: NAD(P)H-dependent oxidoreductase subunit E [Firmicutes bacterium]|nr:NAD(P)H-dependent oxidoreductase subunit E [Bacillota bacterium]MBR6584457.1 NAD(P)H-dependent oxidoreductase subunit E [Bacillota bacterium]
MANVCNGCADALAMEKALDEVIARYKGTKGPLIPVLHEAQAIYGYLPFEVQLKIAEGLDLPLADVYGVVSFYTGFTTKPKGKYRVSVCMGTACYVKGAEAILDKFTTSLGINVGDCTEDGKFSLDACRCVGACGLAPVVMINDDVYGNMTPDKVEDVLKKYEDVQEGI